MVVPAIDRTLRSRTPFVFSGGSAPQFFGPSYTHSVGTLIQVGQRLLPCVQLYSRLGAATAAIISTSDTFQVTTYGILRAQTAANNITTLFNTTIPQFASQETFKPTVDQIVALKPDVIFCCQADVDFIPFLTQLRKATVQDPSFDPEKSYQPKAIFNTNSVSATVAYTALSWAADLVFAGDQWAPFLNFTDARFGSTLGFAQTYTAWLRSRGFNYSIGFTDAASVMAGFVMQSALENAASLSKEDIITALHSVNLANTFFGAVRFSATGELAGTGLCRQLQYPSSAASFVALSGNATTPDTRVLTVVGPDAVRTSNVTYPAIVKPPPQSGLTSSQTTLVIVLSIVGGLLIIAVVVLLIVFLVKREFSIIFIPKSQTNAEWGSSQ
jgi:ABC-type branched-subunit amino acid transport system substrate-binding protein